MENYEISLYQDQKMLDDFLDTWPVSKIEKMTLEEYTNVNDRFTFTQWVETQTILLGSIKGRIGSSKFGIYKRRNSKREKNLISNDTYSWTKHYGESNYDEIEVFEKVRGELLRLIGYAQELDFEAIEKFKGFYQIYKWKVAFLYSSQSMVPVFKQKLLIKFTSELGMAHTKKIEYAKMHRYLYDHKPPNLSVFNFMRKLFHDAGLFDKKKKQKRTQKTSKYKKDRKGTNDLNTDDQIRKGREVDTIATQHHKKFQKRLMRYLKNKYPYAEITFEQNFIDLLLVSHKEVHYYEVKTAQTPEKCIKQGLGQLLSYSYFEENIHKRYKGLKKKIVIFGKWKASLYDSEFIEYVNNSLDVNFEYLSLEEIE